MMGKWLCKWMGWHKPIGEITHDGCSYVAVCRYCGKKILQDSQLNWFTITTNNGDDNE